MARKLNLEQFGGALELILLFGIVIVVIPGAFLLLECLVAPRRIAPRPPGSAPLPRTTLLIPAHNEAAGLAATLASVHSAAFPQLEILVVADNCTDATPALARQQGVRVLERTDPARIGKGYALAFGINFLKSNPPDIVIVLDADCIVHVDALKQLSAYALETARPVQANYTLRPLPDASSKTALSNFAFLVKNRVRPLGLKRLHAPCLLTGSGMAFPWAIVDEFSLALDHLSEDMWLSVLLTCRGHAPRFCANAFVHGEPPRRDSALKQQRARWERGHLQTMVHGIPRLVRAAMTRQSIEPLWLGLELSIPPLALLVLVSALLFFFTVPGMLLGWSAAPFRLASLNLGLLFAAVFVAWWKFGRTDLPIQTLLTVPAYLLWKIPLHVNTLFRTRVPWTRTERDPSTGGEG